MFVYFTYIHVGIFPYLQNDLLSTKLFLEKKDNGRIEQLLYVCIRIFYGNIYYYKLFGEGLQGLCFLTLKNCLVPSCKYQNKVFIFILILFQF